MDPIDRELAALLSVEPSPEFRARVRACIAGDLEPRPWYFQWRVAGVAAVAAALFIVLGRIERPDRAQKSGVSAIARSPLPSTALTTSPATVPGPPAVTTATYRPPRRNEPEVLVAPSDVRGFRQLTALVRQGRTRLVFPNEELSAASPEPVTDILIAPIAIAPLDIAASSDSSWHSEGDEQ